MKVSICIPVYNSSKYLKTSLQSIFNIKIGDFDVEYIASNNFSSDNSLDILNEFKILGLKIFDQKENINSSGNFNFLIEKSSGDYIFIMHSDDIYHPDILIEYMKEVGSNNYQFIFCNGNIINNTGEIIGTLITNSRKNLLITKEFFLDQIIFKGRNLIVAPSVMIKKELIIKAGMWSHHYGPMHDVDLWLNIFDIQNGYLINKNLIKYRKHSEQESTYHYNHNINNDNFSPIFIFFSRAIETNRINKYYEKKIKHDELLRIVKSYIINTSKYPFNKLNQSLIKIDKLNSIKYSLIKRILSMRFSYVLLNIAVRSFKFLIIKK